MAVMQTPHGRVIGLILPAEDQPMKEVSEKVKGENSLSQPAAASSLGEGAKAVKKAGRTVKK